MMSENVFQLLETVIFYGINSFREHYKKILSFKKIEQRTKFSLQIISEDRLPSSPTRHHSSCHLHPSLRIFEDTF